MLSLSLTSSSFLFDYTNHIFLFSLSLSISYYLLGAAAGLLLLFNGDIFGASGIISSAALYPGKTLSDPSQAWKPALLTSFIMTVFLFKNSGWMPTDDPALYESMKLPVPNNLALAVGGLLVGFGTRLGNGCTTGHGVCGIARNFSPRSIAAVLTFMATATFTVSMFMSMNAFYPNVGAIFRSDRTGPTSELLATVLLVFMAGITEAGIRKSGVKESMKKIPAAVVSGMLFALGLTKSGMVLFSKLFGFLNAKDIQDGTWDISLAYTLGGAITVSFLAYQCISEYSSLVGKKSGMTRPISCAEFSIPKNRKVDNSLITGAAIFGIGFGISGLCPGPAMYWAAMGDINMILFHWPAFILGAYLEQTYKDRKR